MPHGKNLAPYKDERGFPTAGTRFDYLAHLGNDFRLLDWYGWEMKKRHGGGTRRNFRFDDEEESIYLDVCLPEEDYWHRVHPSAARKFKSEVDSERMESSRDLKDRHGGL